jgi:hypothetical protein
MPAHAKTAIIAALVGAFSATATVALAGNGIGAVFNLGQSNSVNQTSLLSGSTAGPELAVANPGAGTALGLFVAAGTPPFTVNSPVKVANLNADQLDGLDSSVFVSGAGIKALANSIHINAGAPEQTLLTIPGLGYVKAQCHSQGADLIWVNNTGVSVDVWRDYGLTPGTDPVGFLSQVGLNGTAGAVVHTYQTQQIGTTLGVARGTQPATRRLAVVHLLASQATAHAQCGFQAFGTFWSTS